MSPRRLILYATAAGWAFFLGFFLAAAFFSRATSASAIASCVAVMAFRMPDMRAVVREGGIARQKVRIGLQCRAINIIADGVVPMDLAILSSRQYTCQLISWLYRPFPLLSETDVWRSALERLNASLGICRFHHEISISPTISMMGRLLSRPVARNKLFSSRCKAESSAIGQGEPPSVTFGGEGRVAENGRCVVCSAGFGMPELLPSANQMSSESEKFHVF